MSLSVLSYTNSGMDFLTPTSVHNRFRLGHSLMASGVFLFLVLSILLSVVSTNPAVAFGASTIFNLSNDARLAEDLPKLVLSEELTTAAQAKAEAMVADNYFEHTAPDGTTGWDYIDETGYAYTFAGENLAASNENDISVVDGWLNSPGHRANLLNAEFSDIGLGIASKDSYGEYQNVYFIVALYAVPAVDKSIALSKTNSPSTMGLTQLKESNFTVDQGLGYVFIGASGALTLSGISVETNRLRKHFHKIPGVRKATG